MNEVTDFMGRFGKKVEAKFGIETDPNLGKKVRITLLASGFRLKSPDEGMDARDDAAQSQDEYDEQRKSRRDMYYPSNGSHPRRRHRFNCHIFTDSDLCNDAHPQPHSGGSEAHCWLQRYPRVGAGSSVLYIMRISSPLWGVKIKPRQICYMRR